MNRKKQAKLDRIKPKSIHPFDNTENWLKGDFREPPWSKEKIAEFQKKIDSAFGAENAILLIWSGDRSYGDAFYTDWHQNGLPKGELERKPVLLFAEYKVNEHDYVYVTCPRWLLVEVHHGSELEASWEASSWVYDSELRCNKRIRDEKPPRYFYEHLKIIAQHEVPLNSSLLPGCCERMLEQKSPCYGKYREPSDDDLKFVRTIRERMDRDGVAQRNDAERSSKLLEKATLSTQYFIQQAQRQRAISTQNHILENLEHFTKDILEKKGSTMSYKEVHDIAKEAFDQQNEQRFG